MQLLKFNKKDVRVLVEHARSCKEHSACFEQMFDPNYRIDGKEPPEDHCPSSSEIDMSKIPAGLHLVADHGVYFMSNGTPRDIVSGTQENGRSRVVYAQGIDPDKDGPWWDRKRSAMGGDDCVLFFSLEDIELGMNAPTETLNIGIKNNGIYVTETCIYLG